MLPEPMPPDARARCLEEGERYGDLRLLDGPELRCASPHGAHPTFAKVFAGAAVIFVAAIVGAVLLQPDLERLVIGGLGVPCLLFLAQSIVAASKTWWSLRGTPAGFAYQRGGGWFPYAPCQLAGSWSEASALTIRSAKGRYRSVSVHLCDQRLSLTTIDWEEAEGLRQVWDRWRLASDDTDPQP